MNEETRKLFEDLLADVVYRAMDAGGWMVGTDPLDEACEKLMKALEEHVQEKCDE